MAVEITRSLLQRIEAEAAASPAHEVCGMLFGTSLRIEAIEPTRNVAADPRRHFEIAPAALLRAHREERGGGPRLIGCYHSHPNGRAWPSATDAAMTARDGSLWLIVAGGEIRLFRTVIEGAIAGAFEPVPLELLP